MVLTIKNFESQQVGPGVIETAPTNLVGVAGTLKATLTWTSATGESGVVWTEEKLVRKEGSAPQGSMDGTVVTTITTKDTYASTGYEDTGLDSTKTYYYKAFAIYDNGTEKGSTDINITPLGPIAAGIYHSATLGLISLSSDGENWITIADKNLGATEVYNDGDTLSEANSGKYYQWGNNYGFPFTGAVTTSSSQVDASTYGPLTYYSSSTFLSGNANWSSNTNYNLWGDTINTVEARRGPCAEGYHIPSKSEAETLESSMNTLGITTADGVQTYLKMHRGGYLDYSNGQMQYVNGVYLTSTPNNYQYVWAYVPTTNGGIVTTTPMAQGNLIRPFKNEGSVPDNTWTKTYAGTGDAGVYWNESLELISISSDGINWITIADKNLWATTVWNYGDSINGANRGRFFQWGNNYPFSTYVSSQTMRVSTVGYGGIGYYSSSTFITGNYNWSSNKNDNLWGDTTNTNEARRGPCAEGYHVPTKSELDSLVSKMSQLSLNAANYKTKLKIPFAGMRLYQDGTTTNQGTYGYLLSSSIMSGELPIYTLDINNDNAYVQSRQRAYGQSIRPFANTPVKPDDSRTVLYPTS